MKTLEIKSFNLDCNDVDNFLALKKHLEANAGHEISNEDIVKMLLLLGSCCYWKTQNID